MKKEKKKCNKAQARNPLFQGMLTGSRQWIGRP